MGRNDSERGTGRTTRALARALIEAAGNPRKRVLYLVHNRALLDYVKPIVGDLCHGLPPPNFEVTTRTAFNHGFLRGVGALSVYDDHYRP